MHERFVVAAAVSAAGFLCSAIQSLLTVYSPPARELFRSSPPTL
jgi:hypothetical protein